MCNINKSLLLKMLKLPKMSISIDKLYLGCYTINEKFVITPGKQDCL